MCWLERRTEQSMANNFELAVQMWNDAPLSAVIIIISEGLPFFSLINNLY